MENHSDDNKRIVKNTIYLYIRLIISILIGLYTSRAFLDALGVEDYGIYNVVGGFVTMLSVFTASITSAAQRFITYALGKKDEDNLKKTFSTFASLYIIVAVFIFLLGESLSGVVMEHLLKIPEESVAAGYWVYHLSLLAFSINLMAIPYTATVIAYERMNFYALVSIGESVFKLVIVFLLYTTSYDRLIVYAALLCAVSVTIRFIYSFYCRRHFAESKFKFGIDKGVFKEVFSYSVWVIIGSSSAIFKEQGVNVVINMFCGVLMNAARGVSVQVSNIINNFSASLGTAISPQITKSYAAGVLDRAIRLTFLLAKVQGVLLLLLSLPIIIETEFLLDLWLVDVPDYAVIFTRWGLILCIARTLDGSVVPLNLATGKVKWVQITAGGVMLLNLPLSYVALMMGFEPVSTMVIGVIIEFIVLYIVTLFLRINANFPVWAFFKESIISVVLTGLLAASVPVLIHLKLDYGIVRFLVVGVVSVIMVALVSFLIVFNRTEKNYGIELVKSKIKSIRNGNH